MKNIILKFIGPPASSVEVKTFRVMHYRYRHRYKGKKFFFTIWALWVSRDAEFYVDSKHTNLY
jgi:hypothetical protein